MKPGPYQSAGVVRTGLAVIVVQQSYSLLSLLFLKMPFYSLMVRVDPEASVVVLLVGFYPQYDPVAGEVVIGASSFSPAFLPSLLAPCSANSLLAC